MQPRALSTEMHFRPRDTDMLGDTVAPQVQGEQISGDAHTRDLRPLQTWAWSYPAIFKEALPPQESYIEAFMKERLDCEPVAPTVARHVGSPVSGHESNALSKKPYKAFLTAWRSLRASSLRRPF